VEKKNYHKFNNLSQYTDSYKSVQDNQKEVEVGGSWSTASLGKPHPKNKATKGWGA
jgi:hypothetical protein